METYKNPTIDSTVFEITAYELAQRFVGLKEIKGGMANPQIMAMLKLDNNWPEGDEVPWCSAFVNYICWLLRLPRSKNLMARSWLTVGKPITFNSAQIGFDVAILKRKYDDPGSNTIDAPGHVGFYGGTDYDGEDNPSYVFLLGGNQSDSVNLSYYPISKLLGVRRLI